MTREQAITKLALHLMQCGMLMPIEWIDKNGEGSDTMLAFNMAMEALREQAERSKGCVFCNDERHRIREVFDEGTAKIINAENRYALSVDTSRDASIFNIFCCPMCGKKL